MSVAVTDQLTPRISGGLSTVRQWDDDPPLLVETRLLIPFSELQPEWYSRVGRKGSSSKPPDEPSPYARNDDHKYDGDDLLLKRLTAWFQKEGMSWCNNPPCCICGCKDTTSAGVRGARTQEEIDGKASRVELYHCPTCNAQTTTFPRYNSPRKLLETRKGRCGEYANLFGLFCRAAGFETRYISDLTDHVWVEVWSNRQRRWIHADSCEGQINAASMYEHGWGKKLNYILAFTAESVVDVTRRYTRNFGTDEFQGRRRQICVSEMHGEMMLAQVNSSLRMSSNLTTGQWDEIDRRINAENEFFVAAQRNGTWDSGAYTEGRISGSLAWRAARHELGSDGVAGRDADSGGEGGEKQGAYFLVESFHPAPYRSSPVNITVTAPPETSLTSHECITVSQVPCAVGLPKTISVVTIDEKSGCVLQSRSFSEWLGVSSFLNSIPDGRVVAVSGDCSDGISDRRVLEVLSRFGGFRPSLNGEKNGKEGDCILFIGQANYHPEWATLEYTSEAVRLSVTLDLSGSETPLKLRTEFDAVPTVVSARLPERIMPLRTQLLATHAQKRQAFQQFMEEEKNGSNNDGESTTECYTGYATKSNAPVYLVAHDGFPLQRSGKAGGTGSGKVDSWKTYHYLPEPLVPESEAVERDGESPDVPTFDIPIDTGFFANLLGHNLLKKIGGVATPIETASALHNTRLVAFYFSAHWCPPCRRFTPLLCEFYDHMREELPSHGLEIVFVSSDRDPDSFDQYYGSMPWLAVPFENRFLQQSISARYGVRGIPALVVLDTVSGQIVASSEQSRSEVMRACQGGDSAISDLVENTWLKRIPPETQSLWESLVLSVEEDRSNSSDCNENAYLVRSINEQASGQDEVKDPSEQVKEIFTKLVGEGLDPNAAAAKAIHLVAQNKSNVVAADVTLQSGSLGGSVSLVTELMSQDLHSPAVESAAKVFKLNENDATAVRTVISTSKKYLQNVEKGPSMPKFRSFKMSNKVFDRITAVAGGVDLLRSLGFAFYATDADFMACVPLAADLKLMQDSMDDILREYSES